MRIARRADWMADDREWFRQHPHCKTRRRRPLPGEYLPEQWAVPSGYHLEILVEQAVAFTSGDALRWRWPLFVPEGEGLQ
jgi:hypothetical protein